MNFYKFGKIYSARLYVVFYIISAVAFVTAAVNYHSSTLVKNYTETTGEICNVEAREVLWHQEYVTRYSYDVVWYADGEEYVKHMDEQTDAKEEGETIIWVSRDNQHVAFSSSVDIKRDVPIGFLISVISGSIGLIIYKLKRKNLRETKEQRAERLGDRRLYSGMGFVLACSGLIMMGIDCFKESKKTGYFDPLMIDFCLVCVAVAVICVIVFITTGRQLKKK